MKIIRHPVKARLHRPVVALGTFDGVHLGHRRVIEAMVKQARRIKAHSAVITFDPHPQEVISPERGLKLLTTLAEREAIFVGLGAEAVVVISFSPKIRQLACDEFVKRYLVKKLGIRWVFVGYDYAFGKERCAGSRELKRLGKKYGFGVTVVPPVKVNGRIPKSGKIRELLSRGEFTPAMKLLGHPYRITGRVIRGEGRGAALGFPTANLKVDRRKLLPASGVYVGFVDGKKCLVNIGSRPTFGAGRETVEVHVLNFSGGLRGKSLKLDLFCRLREEKQFSDVRQLVAQIKKDIVRARGL